MWRKLWLVVEVLVLCLPALAWLTLGLLGSPLIAMRAIVGPDRSNFALATLSIGLGLWGTVALVRLSICVLSSRPRHVPWNGLWAGVIACVLAAWSVDFASALALPLCGPLLACAHLLYLARRKARSGG